MDVQLGLLQHLDFSNHDVVEGENELAGFGDGLGGGVGQQPSHEFGHGVSLGFLLEDSGHMGSDLLNLGTKNK